MKGGTTKINKGKKLFQGTTRGASVYTDNKNKGTGKWQGLHKKGFRSTKVISNLEKPAE